MEEMEDFKDTLPDTPSNKVINFFSEAEVRGWSPCGCILKLLRFIDQGYELAGATASVR